jgi:hypothetical protein
MVGSLVVISFAGLLDILKIQVTRREKSMLQPLPSDTNIIPSNQARNVLAGTSSSVFRTAEATSG